MSHEYEKDAAFMAVTQQTDPWYDPGRGWVLTPLASTTTPQEKLGSAVGTQTATLGGDDTTTATTATIEEEKQTLIDIIRQAGGEVASAAVEGTADLGNLVLQAVTLGQGPRLEAVVPNIMDIFRGGIGGTLVLGGGQQTSTVVGTGQTGVGRGTKVAVGNVIGGIVNILRQGGSLIDVITQFPNILTNNLPGLIASASAAGYAFTDDDKQTMVEAGLKPSILDADDTTTTTPTTEPEAIVFTPTDQQYETVETAPTLNAILGEQQQNEITTPAELAATLGYESTETVKTPAELAAMLGYETADVTKTPGELAAMLGYETAETTRTPAELAAMLGFDTATTVRSPGELTGMLGFETAETVRSPGSLFGGVGYETAETTRTPAELAAMLSYETGQTVRTPAEIAATLEAEKTQTIRSSGAPTLTTTLGGGGGSGGGGGLGYTTGARTVSVEPGPLVDIPGFYDISSRSIIPDYIDELIERSKKRQGTA